MWALCFLSVEVTWAWKSSAMRKHSQNFPCITGPIPKESKATLNFFHYAFHAILGTLTP